MAEALCIATRIVIEGEPYSLPEGAITITAERIHWSMDGKTRWRIVYALRIDSDG